MDPHPPPPDPPIDLDALRRPIPYRVNPIPFTYSATNQSLRVSPADLLFDLTSWTFEVHHLDFILDNWKARGRGDQLGCDKEALRGEEAETFKSSFVKFDCEK